MEHTNQTSQTNQTNKTDLVLELTGISKQFPGVLANDAVDFELRRGEVHVLLGENGAGKTTLANIISGSYRPDGGIMKLDGEPVAFRSPRDAIYSGIGMVHQHFRLVDVLTVAENITLGLSSPRVRLDIRKVEEEVRVLSERHGIAIDPRARIHELSVGEQQRVDILKMLYRNTRILILDEPTAVLTPQESEEMIRTLREMARDGCSIIFVSHKLHEVMAVADRITVLRAGKKVATRDKTETSIGELTRLMVGRDLVSCFERKKTEQKEPVIQVEDLVVPGDRDYRAVDGFSLTVHRGEIVGLAGVSGNGQRELSEAIAGLRPATGGRVLLNGEDLTNRPPLSMIRAGLSLIPEDRMGSGLLLGMDLPRNVILKSYRGTEFSSGIRIRWEQARQAAARIVEQFAVKVARLEAPVRQLSGGNQQKLLIGREVSGRPGAIIAVHPNRGIDVKSKLDIQGVLVEQRNQGTAILLISDDLDELLELSDRIVVIYEGKNAGEVDTCDADIEDIGLRMAGCGIGEARPDGGAEVEADAH